MRDVLRDRIMGGRHTRHQVPVHVPSNQVSGAHRDRDELLIHTPANGKRIDFTNCGLTRSRGVTTAPRI